MNINKFTQKSMEAVQNCEKIASDYGNQEIEQEHLLYSLLTLDDSLITCTVPRLSALTALPIRHKAANAPAIHNQTLKLFSIKIE